MGGRRQPDGMSEANLQRCHPRRGVFPSPGTEQVGMEPGPAFSALPANYQPVTTIHHKKQSCQVPCFFMRLGMDTFSQFTDTLPFSQIPSCQLVQKSSTRRLYRGKSIGRVHRKWPPEGLSERPSVEFIGNGLRKKISETDTGNDNLKRTILKNHVVEKPRRGWRLWRHGRP